MILQSLYRLAAQERLIDDPDYEIKPVSWVVRLGSDGSLKQIAEQRHNLNEGTNRKPKYEGKPVAVPRQPIRTSGDLAFFLVDKSEYALGFDPAGKRPAEKLRVRVKLFLDQVEACAQATKDDGVAAVATFLREINTYSKQIESAFQQQQWAANDLFAFQVGLSGNFVHLRPVVRTYWKQIRSHHPAKGGESFRCLVTGAAVTEPGLFPLLKKVPGGTSSGVSLVSFNANAFESYGFSGNENAPISREAAEHVGTVLNRLLHDAFPSPGEPGTTLPRRNVRLGGDAVVCFWAGSNTADANGFADAVPDLLEAESEERVGEVYRSIWRGKETPIADPSPFYVLVLSGAQGRAVVRDWIESTLAEACRNLQRHFSDLEIVRSARQKKETTQSPVIPLRWLMNALAPEGSADAVLASLEAGLIRAAFTGVPYPFQILQRALVRARVECGRDEWIDAARRDARAALLRAVLNRRRVFDPQAQQRYPEVPVAMNPQVESEGYVLGLLMAVLERLQSLALGDINASVIDRYFAAASATPRSVFVRLLKNAQHHMRKAEDAEQPRDRAQAARLRRIIDDICFRFKINPKQYAAKVEGFPAHFDLEQQGLFVLGYHQMRHWLWMTGDERQRWESEHPDAPRAFLWVKREPTDAASV